MSDTQVTIRGTARAQSGGWGRGQGVGGGYALGGGIAYENANPGLFARGGNIVFAGYQTSNRDVVRERASAVRNSRIVDRNNALIHSGINKRADNLVGRNLRLRAMPNWRALSMVDSRMDEVWALEFADAYENLFSLWADDPRFLIDAERHLSFGGLMHLAARNAYGADGETMIVCRYDEERRDRYNGKFATFLEVIDTDRISNRPGEQNGRYRCDGRILDEWGAAVGFDIETRHPSERLDGLRDWTYVPRETTWGRPVAIHWFNKHRAGFQRGMPAILHALRDIKMLDKFDDFTLKAAALAAFLSIYVKSEGTTTEVLKRMTTQTPTGGKSDLEALWDAKFGLYDELNIVADGQQLPILPPGDEIAAVTANRAADNTDSFHYIFERKMASILELGTANFTGDYSRTSFASIRAEFMDAWRSTVQTRHQYTQATGAPINMAFMEECLAHDMLPMPRNAPDFFENATAYTQCEFRGPGMGTIDPVKDPTGAGIAIAGGLSNPQDEAASRGTDLIENIDAIASAQAYAKRKGVTLTWGSKPAATPGSAADAGTEPGNTDGGDDNDDTAAGADGEQTETNEQ